MTAIAGKRVDLSSYRQRLMLRLHTIIRPSRSLARSFSLEVRAAQLRKWIADDCVLCVLAGWLHNDVVDDEGDVR
jgi:hypothetical protein